MPLGNRWIMPVASLVPLLACVYAFSLGPSPYKLLEDFRSTQNTAVFQAPRVDREALIPVLVQEIQKKDAKHRATLIQHLGSIKSRRALLPLERILKNKREPEQVRSAALRAIFSIDQGLGVEQARPYQRRADALGQAAQRMIAGN